MDRSVLLCFIYTDVAPLLDWSPGAAATMATMAMAQHLHVAADRYELDALSLEACAVVRFHEGQRRRRCLNVNADIVSLCSQIRLSLSSPYLSVAISRCCTIAALSSPAAGCWLSSNLSTMPLPDHGSQHLCVDILDLDLLRAPLLHGPEEHGHETGDLDRGQYVLVHGMSSPDTASVTSAPT
nr:unnamed protein product [Digitaria exilis]